MMIAEGIEQMDAVSVSDKAAKQAAVVNAAAGTISFLFLALLVLIIV